MKPTDEQVDWLLKAIINTFNYTDLQSDRVRLEMLHAKWSSGHGFTMQEYKDDLILIDKMYAD